jgi:hypothetical protein
MIRKSTEVKTNRYSWEISKIEEYPFTFHASTPTELVAITTPTKL